MSITADKFSQNPNYYIENISKIKTNNIYELIKTFADIYYNNNDLNNNLSIDDNIFDLLVDELKKREPNHKYFNTIGAPIQNDKVKLPFPMFSLNKVKPDNINNWINSHKGSYSLSDKLDGMSAMLYNNHLYKRGQGLDGQDINYLLKHINIGKVDLNKIKDIAIRGELIFSKNNFKILNKNNLFKNSRNAVSGVINQKNPDIKLCQYIDFVAYNVIHPIMKQEEQYNFLKDNGFNVVYNKQVNNLDVNELKLLTNDRKEKGDYEIDGIVIVDNPISFNIRKNNLEDINRNPSYSVAFKFLNDDNVVEAEVEFVEWNISRYNYLKPKIKIKPIELMGSVINYATGHNAKFIIDNNIGKGSIIKITKSGEVIPKVIEIVKSTKADLPNCNYKWNDTNVDLLAIDENNEKRIQIFLHEVETNKIKFLSEKSIEKLINLGIYNIVSLIGEDDLLIKNFGKVAGPKIMNSLKSNLENTTIEQLMAGCGYFDRGLGVKKFKLINDNINIGLWNNDNLLKINGIGKENAKNALDNKDKFIKYYNNLKNKCNQFNINLIDLVIKNINDVKKDNVDEKKEEKIKEEKQNEIKNPLYHKTVVMTGFRDKDIQNFIFKNNGFNRDNISQTTDILIVKEKSSKFTNSSKYIKALQYGITIMTKEEFENKFMNK